MARLLLLISLLFFLVFLVGANAQTGAQPIPSRATAPIPEVLFIPTPDDIVTRMLELAKVGKEDVVYDLGCGDGRILVAAAKTYHCRAVGFDIDPRRVKDSRENLRKNSVENLASAEERDLFDVDLRPATVITLYLSPKYNARLIPKLEQQKPGSRIVSHLYGIEGIEPDQVRDYKSEKDEHVHPLYLWTTPLRRIPNR